MSNEFYAPAANCGPALMRMCGVRISGRGHSNAAVRLDSNRVADCVRKRWSGVIRFHLLMHILAGLSEPSLQWGPLNEPSDASGDMGASALGPCLS